MAKKLLIANWKMNPLTEKEARELFEAEAAGLKKLKSVESVICPPFPFIPLFGQSRTIWLGGQDLFWELQGAYTGEVSGKMLKHFNCRYVIVGHSERREYFGESDEIINLKIKTAIKSGLKPIFCVGEQVGQEMGSVLDQQLKNGLAGISKNQIKEIVIAYEPVWAIGTGNACSADNAMSATLFIRKVLTVLYSRFLADNTMILYGGSVDSKNAADYIKESKMNGLLVGGASLDAGEFIKIGESIDNL